MKTMDIRIKMTPDIIKDSDAFGESVADKSNKADHEFNVYESRADILAGVNILHKLMKLFQNGLFKMIKLFPKKARKMRLISRGFFAEY